MIKKDGDNDMMGNMMKSFMNKKDGDNDMMGNDEILYEL